MITETTAISCAAFGALSTGLGIAAGIGWMRCARLLKIARDECAHLRHNLATERSVSANRTLELLKAQGDFRTACSQRDAASDYAAEHRDRATDLEDQLRKIEQARHAFAKHARASQLAQQAAAKEARTRELQQNIADRAEPVRIAA